MSFTIATPCPRCGAYYLGVQMMVARVTDGKSCMGSRKVCRCGWKGRTFGPNPPDGIRYEPSGHVRFSQNWEAQAREFAESLERCCQIVADHMAQNIDDLHAIYRIADVLEPYCAIDAFREIVPDDKRQRPLGGLFSEVSVSETSGGTQGVLDQSAGS